MFVSLKLSFFYLFLCIINKGGIFINNEYNYNPHSEVGESPFKDFARWLTSLDPYEYSALSAVIGLIIAKGLTVPEQNSIGNWLESVGQIILTVNAQASINTPSGIDNPNN
ncbi:MAG: hypothetical protein IJX78_06585 [Bacilli bacterium]|nr:hypothetical protein [Bacilli bacterium]